MSEQFDTVRILLEARRRIADGAIFSSHRPATPGDHERLQAWPSGGLIQLAHAMLVEYMRREAYVIAISLVAQGEEVKDVTPQKLEEALRVQIAQMAEKFAAGAVEEALSRIKEASPSE